MRVVAAKFSGSRQALDALDVLRRELEPPDLAVAPLAPTEEPAATDALLAGCFPDDQARAAVELVERAGGVIVADIDASWTDANTTPVSTQESVRLD